MKDFMTERMVEPEKPFACTMPECGKTFTNEDHLHVHTKKHDMVLQLGSDQKAAFVADQTPTPTRFIRNCEEVGLFQDLQSVNPFDEGFKRAMEAKHCILSLENAIASSTDELHTPQMMFPLIDPGDSTLYSTTNNQRNITISRSSSDESGAIKEFETTTISKLTNEVTTISRVVEKHEDQPKSDDLNRKDIKKDSVSYTNNVIKIHSEIRKDCDSNKNPIQTLIYEDTVIKNNNVIKDVLLTDTNKLQVPDMPPMMSQKSIDFVVDSLTNDLCNDHKKVNEEKSSNYEVIIKLPNGKQVRMQSIEEIGERNDKTHEKPKPNAKEKLKKVLTEKSNPKVIHRINGVPVMTTVTNHTPVPVNTHIVSNIVPITAGTLIPVTLLNTQPQVHKVPIVPLKVDRRLDKKPAKRKSFNNVSQHASDNIKRTDDNDCDIIESRVSSSNAKCERRLTDAESKSAASRRYRARLKEAWIQQSQENRLLKEANERLTAEKAMLKFLITEHMKKCPNADDLRAMQEKLKQTEKYS